MVTLKIKSSFTLDFFSVPCMNNNLVVKVHYGGR